MSVGTKICRKCERVFSINQFSRDCTTTSGLQAYCKECNAQYEQQYRKANFKKIKVAKHHYYLANRASIIEKSLLYVKAHPESTKVYQRRWHLQRYRTDPRVRLGSLFRRQVQYALRGERKLRRTFHAVGYTLGDLATRLRSTIPSGYTWADLMAGRLHIDHIIPVSAFNFSSMEDTDFKRAFALENLRLLPASENIRKSNKLLAPFQPSLGI